MNSTQNNQKKRRVGILYGGQSAEHDVSIQSARNILEALDKNRFLPVPIYISKDGAWYINEDPFMVQQSREKGNRASHKTRAVVLPGGGENAIQSQIVNATRQLDVIFPVLHGPMGEDGTIQGLLELLGIPYVGAGVLASALCMDKDMTKKLLGAAGIPTAEYLVLKRWERSKYDPQAAIEAFGLPLFVKPANMGSSIGVSKVESKEELLKAIDLGFQYDDKILIEKAVDGQEIECAVLGNDSPQVSVPGRIVHGSEFYTYDTKYQEGQATLEIPAVLSESLQQEVQHIALRAYKALECRGLARVDMFVTKQGKVYVNEINTLPGFTKFSMYPKLWEVSGITYTNLITMLIEFALNKDS